MNPFAGPQVARCKVDEEYIQSDRLPIYYEMLEKLIGDGKPTSANVHLMKSFRKKTLAKGALSMPQHDTQRST